MRKFLFAGLSFSVLMLHSCGTDDNNTEEFNQSDLLKTTSVLDRINHDDFQLGMETANDHSSLDTRPSTLTQSSAPPCATVTQTSDGNTFPRTFEVDFGDGCTHNGVTRSGKLIITLTNFMMAAGSTMTIERENYVVNGFQIEGTVTVVNQTTGNIPQWTRTVTGGQITGPNGGVFTHSGTRTIRQIEGASTPFIMADNTFEVSAGTSTITRPNGTTLTSTVATPLIKHANCPHISAGVVHLEGTNLNGDLDYGDDTCDNLAVYTHVDGTTHTIQLN